MRNWPPGMTFPVENLEFQRWFYVYRYFNQAGELLYVGVTAEPYTRWTQHRRLREWSHEVTHVSLEQFAYEDLAYAHERKVIRAEAPRYNVKSTEAHDAEMTERMASARRRKRESVERVSPLTPNGRTDGLTDGRSTPTSDESCTYVTRAKGDNR